LQTKIGKRGNVVRRGEECVRRGSRKRTGENLETQGDLNIRRRRVTFVLDYFSVSGEGE
jgi:hypothetical protein